MVRSRWRARGAHAAAVAATAVVGAAASRSSARWYDRLDTPPWRPPAALFGPVWTVLYGLVGYAGSVVWLDADHRDRRRFAVAYATNLALNAGWTWTFFRARLPKVAAVHATVLEASTVDLIRRAAAAGSPNAAVALVPYALWGGFAAVLNADIARRNPNPPR